MILHFKSALLLDCCAVGAGAVAGALLRYGASKAQARYRMEPWAIPAINIAGSFLLGALSVSSGLDPRLKLMAGTGFCGALTTFSTFSVDTVTLLHKGKLGQAVGYVLVNNVGGILAAALAIKIFRGGSLPPPPPGASPRGGHQPIDSLVRAAGWAHSSSSPPPPATAPQKKNRLAAAAAASLPAPWGRSRWGVQQQQQQQLYRPLPSPPSASASPSYKRAR